MVDELCKHNCLDGIKFLLLPLLQQTQDHSVTVHRHAQHTTEIMFEIWAGDVDSYTSERGGCVNPHVVLRCHKLSSA